MHLSHTLLALVLVCAAALLAPAIAQAQDAQRPAEPQDTGWFTVGLGLGGPHGYSGVIAIDLAKREHLVELGARGSMNLEFWTYTGIAAYSISYGRTRVGDWGRLAAAVGPAFIFGNAGSEDQRRQVEAPGVVLMAQAFTPGFAGIGVDAFIALNRHRHFGGLSLTLAIEGAR